jgi:branched-subunit amino acid aminotransferase/4-amino-4-deoxychorismate lyase
MIVFLNGKFLPEAEAFVPLNDRGFLLGDGLFETIRVAGGKPIRFAQHLERLARGADFLKIAPPFTPKELQRFAVEIIGKNELPESILRVTLTRGPGARGYSTKGADKPTLAMTLNPLPPVNPDEPLQWSLVTSSFRIPAGDPLASFKTTSKLVNVLARAAAEARGADEALLLNTNGEVAETSGGNIFWLYRDRICTVPTGRGVLPGITRAVVLEICQSLGLETNKCVVKPEQLRRAEGIFVTQSALGIVPVVAFDGSPVAPSPLVDQIAGAYNDMLMREQL